MKMTTCTRVTTACTCLFFGNPRFKNHTWVLNRVMEVARTGKQKSAVFFQVWNGSEGQELAVCSRHDGWVSGCWFSRDSDLLVSVSNNIKV